MVLPQTEMNLARHSILLLTACCTLLTGCADPPASETKSRTGIIGKKSQDIGEFKPEDGEKIADLQVKPSANPTHQSVPMDLRFRKFQNLRSLKH